MLVIRAGKENDPHWNDSARLVLTAFIAYVCACEDEPEKRTLDTVSGTWFPPAIAIAKAIEIMQMVDSHCGVVQRQGHSLTWFVEKELGSVMTTVQRQYAMSRFACILQHLLQQFQPALASYRPRHDLSMPAS